jgi:hypothetical protein
VKMGEKDMADPEAQLFSVGQVLLDVALRVNDNCGCARLVTEEIGGMRQASEVVLFQNHGSRPSLTRPIVMRKPLEHACLSVQNVNATPSVNRSWMNFWFGFRRSTVVS